MALLRDGTRFFGETLVEGGKSMSPRAITQQCGVYVSCELWTVVNCEESWEDADSHVFGVDSLYTTKEEGGVLPAQEEAHDICLYTSLKCLE